MRIAIGGSLICLFLQSFACNPPNGPNDPTAVRVALGSAGQFGDGITAGIQQGAFFDIRANLPAGDRDSATFAIDPADVTVDFGTTGADANGVSVTLLVFVTQPGETDPCRSSPNFALFNIAVNTAGVATVSPESAPVADDDFPTINTGTFGLCLVATADQDVTLTVAAIELTFVPAPPVVARSCSEVLAIPEVQEALAALNSNGIQFRVPLGSERSDLEGIYALDQETTFDPDDSDVGDTEDGTVTLTNQRAGSITRSGFGGSVEFFLESNAGSIGFCTLARTNAPACDQTVARLENLTRDPATRDLSGDFLAVAVRRHRHTSATCGERGDFIYGTLTLTASEVPSLVTRTGKVVLPENFVPDLVALPDSGAGVVTNADRLAALRFDTSDPFGTEALIIPPGVSGDRAAALGLSLLQNRLALATDTPPRVVTYNLETGISLRTSTETPDSLVYTGDIIDFALDGSVAYVPGSSSQFANRVNLVRTDNAALPDIQRRLFTPVGATAVHVRRSPDGAQLAVLLSDDAPEGEADLLSFVTLSTGAFVIPPINLTTRAGGTAFARELVYSAAGNRIFLAGAGAVLAVDTASPYNITRIDISAGAGDDPVALALSGDGEVLAVAVDDSVGDIDFAVIDARTLAVLNTQDLPGIGARRALDVAHFAGARVAMVANLDTTVVAVQTAAPFLADEPISIADVPNQGAIGRIVSGGDRIAVTNLDESAVYLFELAE